MLNMIKIKIQLKSILIGIALFSSCSNADYKLANNKTFSKTETNELINLLQKFDKSICEIEKIDEKNIQECYISFSKRIWNEIQEGEYSIGLNKELQDEIISNLSEELKNEIWFKGKGVINRRYPINSKNIYPDTVESISINQNKYYQFLKNEVANVNSNTKKYFERLQTVGDISPSMFADLAENYSKYNLNDERVKLLYVIHYLTINQNNLISEESYQKLRNKLNKE